MNKQNKKIKRIKRIKRTGFFLLSAMFIILDQAIKFVVENNIVWGEHIEIISGFLYITRVYNNGAAWSILQGANMLFIPLTAAATVTLIYFMVRWTQTKYLLSFALILGGALGNFVDRVSARPGVVDFVEVHFGTYIFPVFNLADSCIVIGDILMGLYILFVKEKSEAPENHDDI